MVMVMGIESDLDKSDCCFIRNGDRDNLCCDNCDAAIIAVVRSRRARR